MDEDDTWLEKKDMKIKKEERLYRYGENEIFHSVFEDKQFITDNALWIVGGVFFVISFIAMDFVKLLLKAVMSMGKRSATNKEEKKVTKKD